MAKTPYVEGAEARERGKPEKGCPYSEGSADREQWLEGFRSTQRVRRPNATDELNDLITRLSQECKLDGWEAFVESVELPPDILPALMTGRMELLAAVHPRAMTAEEVAKLYKVLVVLVRTNSALQEHSQQVARQVDIWNDAFKQLDRVGNRIRHFANFRRTDGSEDDDC